jgi:putative nucleotidyltransferase with HDIG domain
MVLTDKQSSVLIVDDELPVLSSLTRLFQEEDWQVFTAESPETAKTILASQEIAVLLSDYHMPRTSGLELLKEAKERWPDTVRIIMTGFAELDLAVQAINEGEIFKFVVKPWNDDELLAIIRDAINRFHVTRAMRSDDEATLRSLAQTIELKDVYTRGHCDRVARYALLLAERLDLSEERKRHIRHGCWLHDCGKIGVPESILNKKGKLTTEEFGIVKKHPTWGMEVARQAGLNQTVLDIIHFHHECFDGTGYPNGLAGKAIPLEPRLAAIADVYDALTTKRSYREQFTKNKALSIMESQAGKGFDPELLALFFDDIDSLSLTANEF